MKSYPALFDELRAEVDVGSFDVDTQKIYERWLKRESWRARAEVLPLIVGVDPDQWRSHLESRGLSETEQTLWTRYRDDAGIAEPDAPVPVDTAVTFFREHDVGLPMNFSRLYDFIRQTTLMTEPSGSTEGDPGKSAESEDTITVLGAALSLVAGMPEQCRDEHGFVDGAIVAKLIVQSAVRWFPIEPPTLSESDMAALIDKWLA